MVVGDTSEALRSVIASQATRIESLEEEVQRLTKALEIIATETNWGLNASSIWYGRGHPMKIAKKALGLD